MKRSFTLLSSGALSVGVVIVALVPRPANALTTFAASYFEVADGSDLDFNLYSTPTGIGSLFGGLPTATGGVNDLTSDGQITWWSPGLNTNVIATGTGSITTPYYNSSMYPPNSTGSNDSTYFETAIFSKSFDSSIAHTVTVNVGSDDDALVYLNGTYLGGEPGVHGYLATTVTGTSVVGANSLEIFYADRENTGAVLSLGVSGVPEPSTWAMMLLGFVGLGVAGYRKAKSGPSAFAPA